jgi:hypothetical protein
MLFRTAQILQTSNVSVSVFALQKNNYSTLPEYIQAEDAQTIVVDSK